MRLQHSGWLILFICSMIQADAQFCPTDPPLNPWLADSPWPIYHRNNFAQSSTCIRGPVSGDSIRIRSRNNIQGGTSPWIYFTDPYPNGERAILYSNSTHVFKFYDDGEHIVTIDSQRIDFDPIASFGWNFLLTKNNVWFTYDPKYDPEENQYTRLFKLTDADPNDLFSEIVVLDTLNFNDFGVNRVQHFSLNYEGQIVFNSENNPETNRGTVGVISQEFEVLDTLQFVTQPGEITHHNAFPIEPDNSFYILTTHRLIKFRWDGQELSLAWQAPYDFVHDGPTGSFAEGSGTTPTMLGWGQGEDKLIVMADGHAQNNLVAFWREIPDGWTGIPGMDIHFADSIRLPGARSFSNLFQSIENSPTAFGYDIGIAQFNGFLGYDCENLKGVQKVRWDTEENQLKIAWVNTDINMNGILTYSQGANTVYCSGKESDCNYYYYGLDWDTGELNFRQLLGPEGTFLDDPYYDGGNNNIIDEDGNIYFPGGSSIVKVEIVERATQTSIKNLPSKDWISTPNPSQDQLWLNPKLGPITLLEIYDLQGKLVRTLTNVSSPISISALQEGNYLIHIHTQNKQRYSSRILKF